MAVAQIVALVTQYFDALLSFISDDRTHTYQIANFFESGKSNSHDDVSI